MQESLRQQYLQAMGIQLWESRVPELDTLEPQLSETAHVVMAVSEPEIVEKPQEHEHVQAKVEATPVKPETRAVVTTLEQQPSIDWPDLEKQVETCALCDLHEGRIYPVFGTGDRDASVMIVGEAPGEEEDRQGEPFVGQAGKLFNEILLSIGFKREQVYITNIIKCRPPGNRDPHTNEVTSCMPYLKQQIQRVNPDVIIAVGRIAAHNLLNTNEPLGRLRGSLHTIDGLDTPVIVTYHPAYLLRKPPEKRKVWDDLQQLPAILNRKN